jgi:polysaccharide deacetylase family protein (PEP-CTERM system associated)
MEAPLQNVFSVDLEDWFCVKNLSGVIRCDEWEQCESRVERNTRVLLDLLSRHNVEATFFVLGWIAERFPDLVREVESRGHEIASHGYSHRLLTSLTPEEFGADLRRSLDVLAGCCKQPVLGFRAPSFSVTRKTWWALDVMRSAGIAYDSSIFPIGFHPDYGIADFPLNAHRLPEGLFEIPMSCARVMGRDVPCSGGGYFRLFPYAATRALMRKCNQKGRPVVFYIHPWEVDPEQPRVSLPALARFRHYNNLELSVGRLERLLTDFRFTSIRKLFPEVMAATNQSATRVLRAV